MGPKRNANANPECIYMFRVNNRNVKMALIDVVLVSLRGLSKRYDKITRNLENCDRFCSASTHQPIDDKCSPFIETNQLIYRLNQPTGFYMREH